jgi:hypothetical protein
MSMSRNCFAGRVLLDLVERIRERIGVIGPTGHTSAQRRPLIHVVDREIRFAAECSSLNMLHEHDHAFKYQAKPGNSGNVALIPGTIKEALAALASRGAPPSICALPARRKENAC